MSVRKGPQSMVPTTGTLPAEKKPLRGKTHLEIRISTFYNLNSHSFQGPSVPAREHRQEEVTFTAGLLYARSPAYVISQTSALQGGERSSFIFRKLRLQREGKMESSWTSGFSYFKLILFPPN